MRHGSTWCMAFVGALICLVAACASEEQASGDRYLQHTRLSLERQGDADSLAAAATLSLGSGAQRLSLLARAASLAPDRADQLWLEIRECASVEECDPAPLVDTLHRLDPGNGAAWIVLLDQAIKRGDARATEQYLRAIASSKRFDLYWNSSVARLSSAVIAANRMNARSALVAVIGSEAGFSIPPFQNLTLACKAPSTAVADRLDTCRNIASALRNGDTHLTEMVGISMTQHLWPESSAEYLDAIDARRASHYRTYLQADLSLDSILNESKALKLLTLLRTLRTEQEVTLAVITGAGKAPDPPADWKEPTFGL